MTVLKKWGPRPQGLDSPTGTFTHLPPPKPSFPGTLPSIWAPRFLRPDALHLESAWWCGGDPLSGGVPRGAGRSSSLDLRIPVSASAPSLSLACSVYWGELFPGLGVLVAFAGVREETWGEVRLGWVSSPGDPWQTSVPHSQATWPDRIRIGATERATEDVGDPSISFLIPICEIWQQEAAQTWPCSLSQQAPPHPPSGDYPLTRCGNPGVAGMGCGRKGPQMNFLSLEAQAK